MEKVILEEFRNINIKKVIAESTKQINFLN